MCPSFEQIEIMRMSFFRLEIHYEINVFSNNKWGYYSGLYLQSYAVEKIFFQLMVEYTMLKTS